jgi:hypothetical protein
LQGTAQQVQLLAQAIATLEDSLNKATKNIVDKESMLEVAFAQFLGFGFI